MFIFIQKRKKNNRSIQSSSKKNIIRINKEIKYKTK